MSAWSLVYDSYAPEEQGLREALLTLGNGYICSRGAFPWAGPDDVNYPGTYLAGGYNRLTTIIADRPIVNEDLVNMPNPAGLSVRLADGPWLSLAQVEITRFRQALDFRSAVLTVEVDIRDAGGRETALVVEKFVDMADPHNVAVSLTVEAKGWSGSAEVRADLDGRVTNWGVKRYRELASRHLTTLGCEATETEAGESVISLTAETNQSRLRIATAARTRVFRGGARVDADMRVEKADDSIAQIVGFDLAAGEPVRVEKLASFFTGRDIAISEPETAAREAVADAPDLAVLRAEHEAAWTRLWHRFDLVVEGDDRVQMVLRLHMLHLLQTLSAHTAEMDVGVPARGWHGEAYRGHVFWDELFILPYLMHRTPQISRGTLRYRHNRLPQARQAAAASGVKGAMFPWQSGSDGREESQVMHLNPRSGRWIPDNTFIQRHVSLAIAYNCWKHYEMTGDRGFLEHRGAELIVEIARFFASLAHYNEAEDRYEIHGVMGPDEFHEAYPDAGEDNHGLNNNAYTNVMVAWLMTTAAEALDRLDAVHRFEIRQKVGLDDAELARWQDMSHKMKVPFHDGTIISQFAGYEALKLLDLDAMAEKYGNIQRLDRILEAEGDSANNYQISKQADVLMLFYLFSRPRLAKLFERLGYELTEEVWNDNLDYYRRRTTNGSTLSFLVHAWVLARTRPKEAWDYFLHALNSDITDIQGGTTKEGIHLGLMAGTIDLVQRCLTGFDIQDGVIQFDPMMPEALKCIRTRVRYHNHWLDIEVTDSALTIRADDTWPEAAPIAVRGQRHDLAAGSEVVIPLTG